MSGWRVAMVRSRNAELAVVSVDDTQFGDVNECQRLVDWWQEEFSRPVVLLGLCSHKTYGRPDLAKMVSELDLDTLPWWTLSLDPPQRRLDLSAKRTQPALDDVRFDFTDLVTFRSAGRELSAREIPNESKRPIVLSPTDRIGFSK